MFRYKKCERCNGSGKDIDDFATGQNLRSERLDKKVTLQKLSEVSGWSIGYISDLEHGRKRWNESKLKKYLNALVK